MRTCSSYSKAPSSSRPCGCRAGDRDAFSRADLKVRAYSGPEGPLYTALAAIRAYSGPEGPLYTALAAIRAYSGPQGPLYAVLALAILLAACGRNVPATHLVGFSQCNLGEPWRVAMNAEVAQRARDFPDLQIVYADAQQDNAKQVADVENFLRQRVELLMISPNEARPLTPIVDRVFKAGIPVIVIDRGIASDNYTVFIGADNYEIGRQAGEYIAESLHGSGKIVEIRGLPGSPPAVDRSKGMRDAVARYPGLQIVHDPVANWLREEAMGQMEMALAAQPRIDLVYAHNDPMAMGAYLAAKAKGREKEMKFVGIDALPGLDGGRQAVKDGKLDATFVYPTGGRQAVELAERILKGEKVPHRVTLATEKITRNDQ